VEVNEEGGTLDAGKTGWWDKRVGVAPRGRAPDVPREFKNVRFKILVLPLKRKYLFSLYHMTEYFTILMQQLNE
jgi:hypothetical protein